MKFSEKDLETMIHETYGSTPGVLWDRGLRFFCPHIHKNWMWRQFDLGDYGRCDLIEFEIDEDSNIFRIKIAELKKGVSDIDTIVQIARYVAGARDMIERIKKGEGIFEKHIHSHVREFVNSVECNVTGCVISHQFDRADTVYIANHLRDIKIFDFEFDLKSGCAFKEVKPGWVLTEPNFK